MQPHLAAILLIIPVILAAPLPSPQLIASAPVVDPVVNAVGGLIVIGQGPFPGIIQGFSEIVTAFVRSKRDN
jgi:hypothetical protein